MKFLRISLVLVLIPALVFTALSTCCCPKEAKAQNFSNEVVLKSSHSCCPESSECPHKSIAIQKENAAEVQASFTQSNDGLKTITFLQSVKFEFSPNKSFNQPAFSSAFSPPGELRIATVQLLI